MTENAANVVVNTTATAISANLADWKFRQTALQFTRAGYAVSGTLNAEALERCTEADVRVSTLSAAVAHLPKSESVRPGFAVDVAGEVGLTCQSCSSAFDFEIKSHSVIYVAKDAAELASWEDEAFESIEGNETTSALDLVEDELLLAVPYVPRCEKCEADSLDGKPRIFEIN